MSPKEQAQIEAETIHVLEEKRDAKKRMHEMQWFQKVENEDIASDEDDAAVHHEQQDGDTADTAGGNTVGSEDEWFTEDGDEFTADKGDDLDWISDLNDIKERYGYAFMNGLTKAEKYAVQKNEDFNRL